MTTASPLINGKVAEKSIWGACYCGTEVYVFSASGEAGRFFQHGSDVATRNFVPGSMRHYEDDVLVYWARSVHKQLDCEHID